MKGRFLLLFLLMVAGDLRAQTDSLTMRDDVNFKYQIKKTLLPGFEKLLNFISDPANSSNEITEVINTSINGSREQRLFSDQQVIIENDLMPGGDTSKRLRSDLEVAAYLSYFNINYGKSEDKTVFLKDIAISPLKYKTYFYYNLLFECIYKGTNASGKDYYPFDRIAEIKLVNDSGWHMYFNSIRFATGSENNTANIYQDLIPADTELVNIYNAYDLEERQRLREQKERIQLLLEEGRNNFSAGNFSLAMEKFHAARMINMDAREPKEWETRARLALDKQKAEEERKARLDLRIAAIRKEIEVQAGKMNFKNAKIYCDSLLLDFQISDPEISKMANDLSVVNAAIVAIRSAGMKENKEEAIRLCRQKQVEITGDRYRSHFYFLEAQLLSDDPKPPVKQIAERLTKAIELSGRKHQDALRMRSLLRYEKQNDSHGAIEDATLLVNNDSRSPEVYQFRAMIFEKDKNIKSALADYASAIANKTNDPGVFLSKAKLECSELLYYDAVKTAGDGIRISKCHGMLHFYRGLAEVSLGKIGEAGKDFWTATEQCGVNDSARKVIKSISAAFLNEANAGWVKLNYGEAEKAYTKSILVDSNVHALHGRALCYLSLGKYESALEDLNVLARKNPAYRNLYSIRGTALTRLNRFSEANKDFSMAVQQFPDDTTAYYLKGKSEIVQKDYKAAISSFSQAIRLSPSDSLYHLLSMASYYDKSYDQAIKYSKLARNKHTRNFEIYYICGRAYYDKGNCKSAMEEFTAAKIHVIQDPDLSFWSAAAFEACQKYNEAFDEYDKLGNSPQYGDTAAFRAAVCRIRAGEPVEYPKAILQLRQYIYSMQQSADRSEPYALSAYAYLAMDSVLQANQAIAEAGKNNDKNAMLQLVLACKSAKSGEYENACIYLERALESNKFSRSEIENIKMLEPLKRRSDNYKVLIRKYYP